MNKEHYVLIEARVNLNRAIGIRMREWEALERIKLKTAAYELRKRKCPKQLVKSYLQQAENYVRSFLYEAEMNQKVREAVSGVESLEFEETTQGMKKVTTKPKVKVTKKGK